MRISTLFLLPFVAVALAAAVPGPVAAGVDKAVIAILGGMQCSL
jgi:hypothetical protein